MDSMDDLPWFDSLVAARGVDSFGRMSITAENAKITSVFAPLEHIVQSYVGYYQLFLVNV